MSPLVHFDPIDEQIECGEDETVLDAAFRAGYSLAHGCREGQCSACKCYLLEGEVTLKPSSTFALSENEQLQGYTLLCRAMPDSDLDIELLHFDRDNYRLDVAIADVTATVAVVEALTHDIMRLVLSLDAPFAFTPGQYVDLHVPDGGRRAFSIANLPGDAQLEFIIKHYPGGRFSGMLAERAIVPGDTLRLTGPYGTLRLRDADAGVLCVAGGSGMAPILSLLRALAETGSRRPVRFFYGARAERDLFYVDLVRELGGRLADFAFVPVLSEQDWEGETGLVHEAVARCLVGCGLTDYEAYICGPPPLIDATVDLLVDRHGLAQDRIHVDKFTTAAEAGGIPA